MSGIDWSRVTLTEHMTEAAALIAACQVVFDFETDTPICYDIQVFRHVKGESAEPFFALGRQRDVESSYRPLGEGPTPEAALQDCLEQAGVYHRRHVKQAAD